MARPQSNPSYIDAADEGSGVNALSTSTEEIMAANEDRQYCWIKNLDSTIVISLAFGEDAVDGQGIVLAGGEIWVMPSHTIWTGAIDAIAASSTPSISFVEW